MLSQVGPQNVKVAVQQHNNNNCNIIGINVMRAALTPTVTAPNVYLPRIQAPPLCQLWQVLGPKGFHTVAGQFNLARARTCLDIAALSNVAQHQPNGSPDASTCVCRADRLSPMSYGRHRPRHSSGSLCHN